MRLWTSHCGPWLRRCLAVCTWPLRRFPSNKDAEEDRHRVTHTGRTPVGRERWQPMDLLQVGDVESSLVLLEIRRQREVTWETLREELPNTNVWYPLDAVEVFGMPNMKEREVRLQSKSHVSYLSFTRAAHRDDIGGSMHSSSGTVIQSLHTVETCWSSAHATWITHELADSTYSASH